MQIKVEFDPILLLSETSYLRRYSRTHDAMFPSQGWPATIYTGETEYWLENFEKIDQVSIKMINATEDKKYIRGKLSSLFFLPIKINPF